MGKCKFEPPTYEDIVEAHQKLGSTWVFWEEWMSESVDRFCEMLCDDKYW